VSKVIFIGIAISTLTMINSCKIEFDHVKCTLPVPAPCFSGTVTDVDGNLYNTVKIGNQCWLKENLKTTRYRNGASITHVVDSVAWVRDSIIIPAWCYYNFDVTTNPTFGKTYNWYALVDTNQLCPAGWHIPTDSEWTELVNYIGVTCDSFLFDSSGFAALPVGVNVASLGSTGGQGLFWSSTPYDSTKSGNQFADSSVAISYQLSYSKTFFPYYRVPMLKAIPFFVRCIAD
jgi:uncharacterized protein (TIGR02145 family)